MSICADDVIPLHGLPPPVDSAECHDGIGASELRKLSVAEDAGVAAIGAVFPPIERAVPANASAISGAGNVTASAPSFFDAVGVIDIFYLAALGRLRRDARLLVGRLGQRIDRCRLGRIPSPGRR